MHREALDFLASVCPRGAKSVIELGSRDINGNPRRFFQNAKYTGVDLVAGPGVDIVADAAQWEPTEQAEVVVCCEVFEHTAKWRDIIKTAAKACLPDGTVIFTAAGPGRPEHSAVDGELLREHEHYANITPDELRAAMVDADLIVMMVEHRGEDVRAVGRKPHEPGTGFALPVVSLVETPSTTPLVSLCVIVKNGERTILGLLQSVEGMFDEIVVVDTGSTDNTRKMLLDFFEPIAGTHDSAKTSRYIVGPDLAEGHGEKNIEGNSRGTRIVLARFGWVKAVMYDAGDGQFAAARNFSFQIATGQWRCYLDADDRIEVRIPTGKKPKGIRGIIQSYAKNDPNVNAIAFPYEYVPNQSKEMKPRVFRWSDGWAWRYPVHEQLHAKHGRRVIGPVPDTVVVHDKTPEEHNASLRRNSEIIRAALADDRIEDDVRSHLRFHHAIEQRIVGRYDDADETHAYIEKTQEASTFWLYARRERIQIQALHTKNLDKALALAGGLWAQLPELKDGPLYVGLIQTLKRNFARASEAFDASKVGGEPPLNAVEDQWMTEGMMPAAKALAYAHMGRDNDAFDVIHKEINPELRHHADVHDLYIEAERVCMRTNVLRRTLALADAFLWTTQPHEAMRVLRDAPSNVRDLPPIREMERRIKRMVAHMNGFDQYKALYNSQEAGAFHSNEEQVLSTERTSTVLEWLKTYVDSPDAPPIMILSVGCNDAIIEEAALKANSRVHVMLTDICELANPRIQALTERYPGRVERHEVKDGYYDWHPKSRVFDAVFAFEIIEHLPSLEHSMYYLGRALTDDGQMFLSVPAGDLWVETKNSKESTKHMPHVRSFTGHQLWNVLTLAGYTGSIVEGADATLVFQGTKHKWQKSVHVDIVVPSTPTPFDAVSHETGFLGGSEEAVIRLSNALAEMHIPVTVYAPTKCRDSSFIRVWNAVEFRGIEEFDPGQQILARNHLVLYWRCPQLMKHWLDEARQHGDEIGYKPLLWLHDSSYRARSTEYAAAHKVLTLSAHHEQCLKREDGASPSNFFRLGNGIDAADFPELTDEVEAQRDPHRVIYASSPERGLATLIEMWPKILEAVPDAHLDVYYDWTQARVFQPDQIEWLEEQIAKMKTSITYHGGVAQPMLHAAMRRSGVWAYPNRGSVETFCITSIKAMASGAWPVTTTAGALPEMVERHGVLIPEVKVDTPLFTNAVIRALTEPPTVEQRRAAREHALTKTWREVADRLLTLIK